MAFSARRAQLSPLHTCSLHTALLIQICVTADGARKLGRPHKANAYELTHFDAFLRRKSSLEVM